MSLLDEVKAESRRPGNVCVMRKLRADDPALYGEVVDVLREGANMLALIRVLQRKGHPELTRNVLTKHAAGECVGCRESH